MPDPQRRRKLAVTKTITVPGNLRIGCDQFNRGEFFECHESFEEIWQEEIGDVRDLYKGLIQVAAGFVHITRANHYGAERLLRTALGYLEPYRPDGALGFDVEGICRDTERCYEAVQALGSERLHAFDMRLAPYYDFDESALAAEAQRWRAWGFDATGTASPMEVIVVE